jgi:type III secretion system chaperone SycN
MDAYGRSMGMGGLGFDRNGVVCLDFESRGTLFLERGERELLAYLVREMRDAGEEGLERAMALCHFRHAPPFPTCTGFLEGGRLVFLVRIPETDVTLPVLEKVLDHLSRMHEMVAGNR